MDLANIRKVALVGRANSGKDTVAKLIAKKLCRITYEHSRMLAFADPIKEMAMVMFPWADPRCFYGSSNLRNNIIPNAFDKEGKPLTYRQILIDIGEDGRMRDRDHWVKVFDYEFQKLSNCISEGYYNELPIKLIVATDVRYPNEFTYLSEKKFFIIKLQRNTELINNHDSETSISKIKNEECNFVIDNDGTIEELDAKISRMITSWGE